MIPNFSCEHSFTLFFAKDFYPLRNLSDTSFFASALDSAAFSLFQISYSSATLFTFIIFFFLGFFFFFPFCFFHSLLSFFFLLLPF